MQMDWLVTETGFLNLCVDFCCFKCINRSKCSSLAVASASSSERAADERARLAAASRAGI